MGKSVGPPEDRVTPGGPNPLLLVGNPLSGPALGGAGVGNPSGSGNCGL